MSGRAGAIDYRQQSVFPVLCAVELVVLQLEEPWGCHLLQSCVRHAEQNRWQRAAFEILEDVQRLQFANFGAGDWCEGDIFEVHYGTLSQIANETSTI